MDYVTELIRITTWSLMRKQSLPMLIPAAQKTIYAKILNRIVRTAKVVKFQVCVGTVSGTPTYSIPWFWKGVLNGYALITYLPKKLLLSRLKQHRIVDHSLLVTSLSEIATQRTRNTYPVYPSMAHGALLETPPKIPKFFYGYNAEYIQVIANILRILPGDILNYYSTL